MFIKFSGDLGKINAKILKRLPYLPKLIKTAALEHFDDSFANQGYTDRTFTPWYPRRKEESRYDIEGNRKTFSNGRKESRAMLIGKSNFFKP